MVVAGVTDDETQASRRFADAERFLGAGDDDGLTRGIQALREAAALGSGPALTRLARFDAAGVTGKPDWDRSVDLLQQAAELGDAEALAELCVLARDQTGSPADLRKRVDIRAWVAPRQVELVMESPRIGLIRNFMSPSECAWIIASARDRLKPAAVYNNDEHGSMHVSERTNSNAAFDLLFVDVVLVFLHARISYSIGLPMHLFEPTMLLHYAPGQQFKPHFDFLDPAKPGLAADIEKRGQRVITFLVYLNEDFDGGETGFPQLGYAFKGRTGDALAFANVDPSGAPDPRTLHAGLAPTRGEKWLLSQWIRNKASL